MEQIKSGNAPAAIGPYSQAIQCGNLVFCSGQLGLDAGTGKLVGESVEAQTREALHNLRAVLLAAGLGLDRVVKTTVFVANMDDFPLINQVYATVFGEHKPARATVEVARLPLDALVEIECIACVE
jgi:2-iminobutanoate/2-iminopropanoate deaminase